MILFTFIIKGFRTIVFIFIGISTIFWPICPLKPGGHIVRNVVEITLKMKTIVRKPLMIKIIKLLLRNLDNYSIYIFYDLMIIQIFVQEYLHKVNL